jgi:hypothetical protein
MTLDLTKITPEVRAAYIERGSQVTPNAALRQARRTLTSLGTHGTKLAAFGFVAGDASALADARDALIAGGVGRTVKRSSKKTATSAQADALRRAGAARLQTLNLLRVGARVLEGDASEGAPEARLAIATALAQHAVAPEKADLMADQIDALLSVLNDKKVAEALKERGGPKLALALPDHISALRGSAQLTAVRRGTPEETEVLRVISGIIVGLVRSANNAARSAATALGEPAIAKAFRLDALYRKGSAKDEEQATPPADLPPSKPQV